MPISKLTIWNSLWIVAAVALWFGGSRVANLFRDRIEVVDANLAAGEPAYFDVAPYRVAAQGVFMSRQPTRVRRIEHWRGKSLDFYATTTLTAHPMTEAEIQADIATWQSTPNVKFARANLAFGAVPANWPDWFPVPSESTYIGTISTSHGWTVPLYRRPNEDFVYAAF